MTQPWMNANANRFYEEQLHEGMNVLEFGAGNSTIWLSRKKIHVLAFEHQEVWMNNVLDQCEKGYVEVVLHEEYHTLIKDIEGEFDVIVVDGIHRGKCIEEILKRPELLKKGGFIVFDDSQRRYWAEEYTVAANALESKYRCVSISLYDYKDAEGYYRFKDEEGISPQRLEQSMFCFNDNH